MAEPTNINTPDGRRQYIADLVARGGVQIDPDDPAFELVILNRLVLDDQKSELEILVGQVVNEGKKMRQAVNAVPELVRSQVAPELGKLAMATTEAKAAIAELAEAQKVSIQQFTAAEKVEFRGAMTTAAKTIAGDALDGAVRALQVAASAHDNAMKQETQQTSKIVLVAVLCGFLGSLVGSAGIYALLGKPSDEEAAIGRAVSSIWSQLDSKTQGRIQTARERMQ